MMLQILHLKAQNKSITYKDLNNQTFLSLSNNAYFQFQNLKGLIKEYSKGKWTYDSLKKQYHLTEIGYSTLNENRFISQKAPKFPYKTATRTTIFAIEDQKLKFIHQEIEPKDAVFQNAFQGDFFIH